MGVQQSKEELLYQQVPYGNIEGIKALHRDGAGLEWVDREGKTPLIVASMMPNGLPLVKTLLDLGANINVFRPGIHNGTPLHHAAKKGLEQTVHLLLLRGANPLTLNDNCQTALDIARAKHFCNVVRTIESKICCFSGWLRLLTKSIPNILEALISPLFTKKIWAVVIPCQCNNNTMPHKFELAVYLDLQASEPYAVIPLWKVKIEEPNFNELDPAIVIHDKETRYKLLSANEGDKQQLMHFYNACKGIPQQGTPVPPAPTQPPSSRPTTVQSSASEDDELVLAIEASIQSARAEGVPIYDSQPTDCPHQGSTSSEAGPSTSAELHLSQHDTHVIVPAAHISSSVAAPSAPPATEEALADGPIHYPSIDSGPVSLDGPVVDPKISVSDDHNGNMGASGSCIICLDAAVEGACIPCGHMAGCMSCLNEIKAKSWGCPVCRAKIDQVVKIYAV